MDTAAYEGRLFGDISAITQINRTQEAMEYAFLRDDWHERLVYGSDYPLPGVMPVFSPTLMSKIRKYNPLIFDFLLKRMMRVKGKQLASRVFETKKLWVSTNI